MRSCLSCCGPQYPFADGATEPARTKDPGPEPDTAMQVAGSIPQANSNLAAAAIAQHGSSGNTLSPPMAPVAPPPVQDEPEPAGGCCWRVYKGLEQEDPPRVLLPLYAYKKWPQTGYAGVCAVIFILLGVYLELAASKLNEFSVSYTPADSEKEFEVTSDMAIEGEARIYYELPEVWMNQKKFIESKEDDMIVTMMGGVKCDDAETLQHVAERRSSADPTYDALVNNNLIDTFRPCGLVALSMFIDEFLFWKKDEGGGWVAQEVDESDIVLPNDKDLYDGPKKIVPNPSAETDGIAFKVGGFNSWLKSGNFYEHFKVWYRTPAAPHVKNLWAVKKGGMPAGTYKVSFPVNSPIWTETWGVPKKYVTFESKSALGNSTALKFLSAICLAVGALEFVSMIMFIAMPARKI